MSEASVAPAALPELTRDEKTYAGLAHALMICTGFVGPLIIYIKMKRFRFVRFHASQAIFWGILATILYIPGTFVSPSLTWAINLADFAISLSLGIPFCLKAMRGEWSDYPVIGRWGRDIIGD